MFDETRIIAAAIKVGELTCSLPKPARHHNIIREMVARGISPHGRMQGFLTDKGEFVDRKEGAKIALYSGQVKKLHAPPNLFSEDLW